MCLLAAFNLKKKLIALFATDGSSNFHQIGY
jgi:hypothetical protein